MLVRQGNICGGLGESESRTDQKGVRYEEVYDSDDSVYAGRVCD